MIKSLCARRYSSGRQQAQANFCTGQRAEKLTTLLAKNLRALKSFFLCTRKSGSQALLRRYGSELVLLDATYKTTKYALPLFFLCVHTNAGYKVVSELMYENEDAGSMAEALSVIKGWND